jgi:hypothetical protein
MIIDFLLCRSWIFYYKVFCVLSKLCWSCLFSHGSCANFSVRFVISLVYGTNIQEFLLFLLANDQDNFILMVYQSQLRKTNQDISDFAGTPRSSHRNPGKLQLCEQFLIIMLNKGNQVSGVSEI